MSARPRNASETPTSALVPLCVVLLAVFATPVLGADVPTRNGFVLAPAAIPIDEILHGGPPRDGIPALDHPRSVPAEAAVWRDRSPVIGVTWNGEARAYPLRILDWHELVNDTIGGRAILVSYCPLCGTGMVFDRRMNGRVRSFGVSGLLFQSDVLMYDRETMSLWSQILSKAVTGPSLGEALTLLRSEHVTFGEWKRRHPGTTVLSRRTGHRRDYARSPYARYSRSSGLRFPAPSDDRYPSKTATLGLRVESGEARAFPAPELLKAGGAVSERFMGRFVRVAWDPEQGSFDVVAPDDVEVIRSYWFAWAAFHPQTTVFRAPSADALRGDASR